jgi:hypothetical protein
MNRKTILIVLTVAIAFVASACGSSSPTVTITTPPPATLEINQSASIAATTTHDKGEGVDWSCAPAGSCGTLNPTHTDSGASTTYTAPSVSGTVTITASSTKKASVTATSTVTVTPIATSSNLSGQYAFRVSGFDAAGNPYAAAGSVTLDGAGNVSSGEEDLSNPSFVAPVVADALTGTYTVGDDGQGTMTLNATVGGVADPLVGVSGVQTLAFTVVNSNHLLITEFDAAATSGGSMDFQSASAITAGFVGNYAFNFSGFIGSDPLAFGGVFTSTGTSFSGPADENDAGSVTSGTVSGTITAADVNGRGTITFGGLTMAYYIVTPEAVYMTEIDATTENSGAAYGQGSTPNFTAASLSGEFVMDEPWPTGYAVSILGPVALVGQFNADGTSAITGVTDYNDAGIIPAGPGPDTLTASYTVATSGYGGFTSAVVSGDTDFTTWGVYFVDPAVNVVDPNNSSGGGAALIVQLDPDNLGAGFITSPSATALTGVNNATDTAAFSAAGDLIDTVGQVIGGNSTATGTASVNDINPFIMTPTSTQTSGASVSGTYTADSTNVGRYTLSITVGDETAPENRVAYVTSSGLALMVEIDSSMTFTQVGSGTVQGQQ